MVFFRPLVLGLVLCLVLGAPVAPKSAIAEPASLGAGTAEGTSIAEPLVFEGRIKALRYAEVANRIDGVIDGVHFSPGQVVREGDLLYELAPESYEAAVLVARANLGRAQAEFRQKRFVRDQQEQLRSKGVASELRYQESANDADVAAAEVAAAEAVLKIAELELSRTRVSAPISGRIGEPLVALGSFVEAESGRPLARIVQLDPIRVIYEVPYEQRLRTRAETGADTVEALLDRITLELRLPGGAIYPLRSHTLFSASEIDPGSGKLQVSAIFPNPDLILLPGLPVQVKARGRRALPGRAPGSD